MEKKQKIKYEDFITIPLSLLSTEVQKSIIESISFKNDETIDKNLCNDNCPYYHEKHKQHSSCDISSVDISYKTTKLTDDIQKGVDFVFNKLTIDELSKKTGIFKNKLKKYQENGFVYELCNNKKDLNLKEEVFKIAKVMKCKMKQIMTSDKFKNYRWDLIEMRLSKGFSITDLSKMLSINSGSLVMVENGYYKKDKNLQILKDLLLQL